MSASPHPAADPTSPTAPTRIRPRDRDTLVQALRAGVVPRAGQQHIQVGRVAEVTSLVVRHRPDRRRWFDGTVRDR